MEPFPFSLPSDADCHVRHTPDGMLLTAGAGGFRKSGGLNLSANWGKLNGLSHRCLPKYHQAHSSSDSTALLLPEWAAGAGNLSRISGPLDLGQVMHYLRDLLSLYRNLWMRDLHIPLLSPKDILFRAEHLLVLPFELETFRKQVPEPPSDPADFCFASPELMEEPEQVGLASGIYNLGMLALFMLQPSGFTTAGMGMSQMLHWKRPPVPSDADPEAARILVAMLQKDLSLRPSGPDAIYVDVDHCCERLEAKALHIPATTERASASEINSFTEDAVLQTDTPSREAAPADSETKSGPDHQLPLSFPVDTPSTEKLCIKPGCGTRMQSAAAFCRICGSYQLPAGTRICPHCAAAVPAGLSYCNQCERVLNE